MRCGPWYTPCPTLFQPRRTNTGLTIVQSGALQWPGRWQSLVGLIPSGWLTQLPIKIQLLRTAAAPRTPPAHRPSHSATPTPETNFLLETGRGIILALFVEGLIVIVAANRPYNLFWKKLRLWNLTHSGECVMIRFRNISLKKISCHSGECVIHFRNITKIKLVSCL